MQIIYTVHWSKAAFLVGAQIGFIAFTAGVHTNPSSTVQRIIDIFSFCAVSLDALGALSALTTAQTLLRCHSTMDQFLQDKFYLEERMYKSLRRLQKYAAGGIEGAETQGLDAGGTETEMKKGGIVVNGDVTNLTIGGVGALGGIWGSRVHAEGGNIWIQHAEGQETDSIHVQRSKGKSTHVQQGGVRETDARERGKDTPVQGPGTGETSVREKEKGTPVQGEETEERGMGKTVQEGGIWETQRQERGTESIKPQEGEAGRRLVPVTEFSEPRGTMEPPAQGGNEETQVEEWGIDNQDISDIRNLITQVNCASIELGVLDHDAKKHCAYNNTALLIIILGVVCFFVALIGFIINSQPTVVWLPTLVVVSVALFIVLRNENRHYTGRWAAISSGWREFVASHLLSRWAPTSQALDLEVQDKIGEVGEV